MGKPGLESVGGRGHHCLWLTQCSRAFRHHLFAVPDTLLYLLSYGSDQTYFEEIKQFYYRDEFSHQVQEWNRQRTMAIERALQQFLYVQMAKELKNKLLAEAKEYVIKVRTGTRLFSSVQSLSCVQLFATPWTAACQASSTTFSHVISPG